MNFIKQTLLIAAFLVLTIIAFEGIVIILNRLLDLSIYLAFPITAILMGGFVRFCAGQISYTKDKNESKN